MGDQRVEAERAIGADPLGDILDRVSDAVVALDSNWRYTYVNEHAARLFGRSPADLVGRHIWTEFPEGVGQPFHLAYEKALADQVFIQMENYYEPWDRWFENRIYPSPQGLSIFFHEITERKRAEQRAAESAALLEAQNRVLELIAGGAPLQRSLNELLSELETQCPGMLCSILLLDPDGVHVHHGAAPSLPEAFMRAVDGQPIGPHAGSCGTAAYRREAVFVEDIATDPLWESYRPAALAHGLRASWSTPILDAQGLVLGTFALYFRRPCLPSQSHLRLIELSSRTAAIAIVKDREREALRTSEERQRLAVTGGNVGIWEWDVVTDRLEWSAELKAIFGIPAASDVTFATFADAVHPDDRPRIERALKRALEKHRTYDEEFRIVRPKIGPPEGGPYDRGADGTIRWVSAKGRGDYDAAGQPVRMIGVALDVTDRKRAEDDVSRREAQLAEAQRIARLGSYEWDISTNMVHRSQELCRIFGVPLEQFPSTFEGYLERVHPDDRAATKTTIESAFRDAVPFEFEERIVRPDGAVRVLHSQGNWIRDSNGRPTKLMGICQDITERKQSEDELRRSEERFQLVARATNDAIWDWDLTTDTLWWSSGIGTLFNYDMQEVADGIDWKTARIHPADRDSVVAGVRAVTASGDQVWSGEYRFERADGSYADVLDRGVLMRDQAGRPIRIIGAMMDVSDRKRALEILEQRVASRTADLEAKNAELERESRQREHVARLLSLKNEELKAFTYTVSHDLKAPLRGIAGYANELDRRHRAGLSPRALKCIDQILASTQNLDRLIEDLLHYARLDAQAPIETEIDLAQMLGEILRERQPTILAEQADVTVDLAVTRVRGWERGLFHVLTNLIDNALKYSRDAAPPRLTITSTARDAVCRIAVGDNGIGFDMKYHDRMFGLFNRLVRQEEFEGTGAGLAIVKKVVEKMHGQVWAESEPGQGATFFVEIARGNAVTERTA